MRVVKGCKKKKTNVLARISASLNKTTTDLEWHKQTNNSRHPVYGQDFSIEINKELSLKFLRKLPLVEQNKCAEGWNGEHQRVDWTWQDTITQQGTSYNSGGCGTRLTDREWKLEDLKTTCWNGDWPWCPLATAHTLQTMAHSYRYARWPSRDRARKMTLVNISGPVLDNWKRLVDTTTTLSYFILVYFYFSIIFYVVHLVVSIRLLVYFTIS